MLRELRFFHLYGHFCLVRPYGGVRHSKIDVLYQRSAVNDGARHAKADLRATVRRLRARWRVEVDRVGNAAQRRVEEALVLVAHHLRRVRAVPCQVFPYPFYPLRFCPDARPI